MEQDQVKELVNWQYFLAATDAAVAAGRHCTEDETPQKRQEKIKQVIEYLWRASATLRYRDKTPSKVTMDELRTVATMDIFPADALKRRD
jgi:hypothetical protein